MDEMKKITPADIRDLHEYELARVPFRDGVIAAKRLRRVALGPLVTLVFENRQTVLFQIQEMLRVERIVDPEKVRDEIDVYNALIPDPGELSATVFIEVTEEARIRPILDSFIGLDEGRSLWLAAGERKFMANFEPGHGREDKISAVHYVRFPLGPEGRELLRRAERARLAISHGSYEAETSLSAATVSELLADLDEG